MTISYLLAQVADLPVGYLLGNLLTSWDSGFRALLLVILILLNAIFVAAEVSLVRIHKGQLETALKDGRRGSARALKVLDNAQAYCAACQLGITGSSIVLGALGVPLLSGWLSPILIPLGFSDSLINVALFVISVLLLTFFHLIIGEQIPRAFGIRKTLGTAIAMSHPLRFFYFLVAGPIWVIEKISNLIIKQIFRMEPGDISTIGHTADELKFMVEETGRAKEVTKTEHEILSNALELNDLCVRDILTPRNEVVVLDIHRAFRENLDHALESKHTRFPLVDGHLDNTLGLIHIKDLLREVQRESMNLFAAKRDLMRVSEKLPLDEMLQVFLSKRAHIALVVDEFGGSVGLVMLDDVLDQVVGDIMDEFDEEEEAGFTRIDSDSFTVEGGFPLHELTDEVEGLDLENRDVSTVGGYITSVAGRIPEPGETITLKGYQASIIEADERSVQKIHFTKVESEESENGSDAESFDEESEHSA